MEYLGKSLCMSLSRKGSVDPTIKTWLETEKRVIVEVIP